MEIAAKFLQKKICNRNNHKTKFYEATNNYKEHKYFKQNPRLSKFAFNLLWNGLI